MKIIWFSEIKWSYLRTRKQHILSNFKDNDEILFVEPLSFNLKNNFNISIEKNIKYITIPQIQNSDVKLFNVLLNLLPAKVILRKIGKYLVQKLLNDTNFKPDKLIISNVYWIDSLIELNKNLNIEIIYDCNDNPLAFPNSKNKLNYFTKTLKYSDKVIIPFDSYKNFIPTKFHNKIKVISNGVDTKLLSFKPNNDMINNLKKDKLNQKIVMYIGSIDTRLDYKLLQNVISDLPDMKFIFIGNIKRQVTNVFNKIRSCKNVNYLSSINYSDIGKYLNYTDVCIIPFQKNELSQYILPNKLFEYSLMKKPIIMTDFNKDLKNLNKNFIIASSHFEFSKLIIDQIKNPQNLEELKLFAKNYEWSKISSEFRNFISKDNNL